MTTQSLDQYLTTHTKASVARMLGVTNSAVGQAIANKRAIYVETNPKFTRIYEVKELSKVDH